MFVFPQDGFEELAGGGEDNLVGSDGVLLAGECHVKEVLLLPELSELAAKMRVVIFPSETKFLVLHDDANYSILKKKFCDMIAF